MMKVILFILVAELWGVTGQILYKKSVNIIDTPNLRSLKSYFSFIKKVIAMPSIWLGVISITIGIIIWLGALAQADLSLVYPIDSIQYIMMLVVSRIFLDEKITRLKLIGTLLVIAGIFFVVMS